MLPGGIKGTMESKNVLALVVALTVYAIGKAYPQKITDRLRPLVETSAQRLVIAEQVALAKWDSGAPVEDTSREELVIVTATKAAEVRGLDPSSVANFFRAQIEANKLIQYSLLADWRRVGKAPDHMPVDLAKAIRPELDQLQTDLIVELVDTSRIRSSASCRTDMAKAVGKYVSEHKNSFGRLQAIALDRAMAAACTS
jgi:chorismate mutase